MNEIGHNNPPSPFDEISAKIDSLYEEAMHWLDGEAVDNQQTADAIGNLINLIKEAENEADKARKEENKPFDEGKAAVQAKYAPLIANTKAVKGKTVRAIEACKKALTPWLEYLDEQKRYAEAEARRKAEEERRNAEEAIHTTNMANLQEAEVAEIAIKKAEAAEHDLKKAERDKATAGNVGRSVHLRTTWTPYMTDPKQAAQHYWKIRKEDMQNFLFTLAEEDVRRGKRLIPGFEIIEERKAV